MLPDWFLSLLNAAKSGSTLKKVLLLLAALAALGFCLASCTTTRSMSVSVEKAEKVNIHMLDSINAASPFVY